jgi:hypothetical protein
MADGKGFAALLSYVAALNADLERTPALLDRISGEPIVAAPVTDALATRRANAAAPVSAEAPAMVRILGQMRAIQAGAADAEEAIESLSTRTEEASDEVVLKISKALAAILDPGKGEGVSGNFDKDTGQFLGGGLSYERARDYVNLYIELQELKKQKLTAFEEYYVNDSITKTMQQFAREFGTKLGDLKSLAKQLSAYLSATTKKDAATGPTSGTLGRPKPTSGTTTSIAVLRLTGGLR